MTVTDLIRELQAMPNQHAPVRVLVDYIWDVCPKDSAGMERRIDLLLTDAGEADEVRNEGAFVMVRGR